MVQNKKKQAYSLINTINKHKKKHRTKIKINGICLNLVCSKYIKPEALWDQLFCS